MSKNMRRILFGAALLLLAALVFVLVNEFVLTGSTREKKLPELPGAAKPADLYDPDLLAPGVLKVVQDKLSVQLAVDHQVVDGILSSCYETSPRRGEEGSVAAVYTAADQIMYGRALVRMGKKSDFVRWAENFDRAYRGEEHSFHAAFLAADDQALPLLVSQRDPHWSVTLAYTRALLEGYRAFGGKALASLITAESERLLPVFVEGETGSELLAGPRTLLAYDEWDIPPAGTVPEPGESQPVERAVGTHLADIDLWAMLALSRFDPAWAPIASGWKRIVAGAKLDSELPLYASAVSTDGVTYLSVTGESSLAQTREQLSITLRLAEIGAIDQEFISFFRSQLRDNKQLPSGWNPVTSGASDVSALPADYALAMMLGRAADDQVLIESAREVMLLSYASSQTSDIFGGWYRSGETARTYKLTAEDNTAVLNALR
ncbi:MAG: hypothetical protein GX838_06520 [Clostridiaceae bacterium]|nr:hypothetical protein [Clostridiaceae bacterium]